MYWIYGLLILFHTQLTQQYAEDTKIEVKVGALFFIDERTAELAFDEAFREINSLRLFELKFVTIKRYIPTDDSYVLQQLTLFVYEPLISEDTPNMIIEICNLACELIASGVAGIFGPSSKASTDIVALIANSSGIPHIQYDWNLDIDVVQRQMNHQMSVSVAPEVSTLSKAYLDIIKTNYGWKKFTFVYDSKQGLIRLKDLMAIGALDPEAIRIKNLALYKNDIRVLWKDIADLHEQRIIVDCAPETLVDLVNAAHGFELLGPFRSWFFTHLDSHSAGLQKVYNPDFRANITAVRLKLLQSNPYERPKTRLTTADYLLGNQSLIPILMYDAVILYANAARQILSELKEYNDPYKRCDFGVSGKWYEGVLIVGVMKNISQDDVEPPFKTENMIINENGLRTKFNLEIYKPTIMEPLSIWNSEGTIQPIQQTLPLVISVAKAPDFSQQKPKYTVVTHFEEPYFMLKPDADNYRGDDKYEGYAVDLMRKLSDNMEFEYEFLIVKGNGKYDPKTKQWDGIMRKLIDHQAQIGICDLTITQLRRKYVDFTVPFMQLGISILFYKADPEPKDIFAFLQPFAKDVWMYMILTQLVMTLAYVFIARISNDEWVNPSPMNPEPDELENSWRTRHAAWLMIGSIMQQGCDMLPRGPPMRMLTAMWWFFALMMLNSYTANLAAVLTSNKIKPTISNLADLISQNEIKFGTLEGGSTSQFFSESNDSSYYKAWNRMKSFEPSAFTSSNSDGKDRVLRDKGKYAFLMETTGLKYNVERHCHLQQIGNQIGEKAYGLAVPLGAEYRMNLSVSLLQLNEKGDLARLKDKWWGRHNVTCEEFSEAEVDTGELSLIELGGVFLVLAGGIMAAVIIGLIEFLWNAQKVAVQELVTPWEAFKAELWFALKFWKTKKPNRIAASSKSATSSNATRRSRSTSRRSSCQSKQSKHSKHSKISKRSKRSKRSRSRSKSQNRKLKSLS